MALKFQRLHLSFNSYVLSNSKVYLDSLIFEVNIGMTLIAIPCTRHLTLSFCCEHFIKERFESHGNIIDVDLGNDRKGGRKRDVTTWPEVATNTRVKHQKRDRTTSGDQFWCVYLPHKLCREKKGIFYYCLWQGRKTREKTNTHSKMRKLGIWGFWTWKYLLFKYCLILHLKFDPFPSL